VQQRAFYVSCDPNEETRQQEELEYNLENDNNVHPLISKSDVAYNKISNQSTRKAGKHKISLPDFVFTVVYTDYHTYKKKKRKQLPIREYSAEALQILMKNKRIGWHPGCLYVSGKTHSYYFPQPKPFVVLDIDGVEPEAVQKIVQEKWSLKLPFSVVGSVSGQGTHLHVWVDLTKDPAHLPTRKQVAEDAQTHYQSTYRFEVWSALKDYFARTIEQDTGLKVDLSACRKEVMAITTQEIGAINAYWKGREPVEIPEPVVKESLRVYRTRHELKNERYLTHFIKEFDRFLKDPEALECVFSYLKQIDIQIGPVKYYEKVLKSFRDNQETITRHWTRNAKQLAWLRCKTENIDIEQATCPSKLFGLASQKHATYVRHFALYIWSLVKTRNRIINRKTDGFSFIDIPKPHFTSDFLAKHWYAAKVDEMTLSVDHLKTKMGDGHTWETICSASPVIRHRFGSTEGLRVVLDALDLSTAKEKSRRRHEIKRFFRFLDQKYGRVPDRRTG
jgi:hypothetical protein